MDRDNEETKALNGTPKIFIKCSHYVPLAISFGFVVSMLGLYGLVYLIDKNLPTPLNIVDEQSYPDAFITERAHQDLKELTEIGPRVVGSPKNEVLTVEFLKRKIDLIIQKAHKNQKIKMNIQQVTGSHYMDYKPDGKFVSYSNLQNIVVKLYGANDTLHSVLINSHFDSVPTSPGGSDDGINVVVMLEMLRKLSKEPQRPLNSLIFLFNGAEETGLQAAHGFITEHKWAKECKVVLNLEAAGAGGKIILFQTGPSAPWLLNYYARVPHPYGQVAGEEIFQTNLIPSDTDFRIFRDYGGLVGLDMAFMKDGYRYHTKYDGLLNIPLGSFQHVGDNSLSLIRNLGSAPEVANPKDSPGVVIFFDYLGLFMVSYSSTVGFIINFLVVLTSFVIFILNVLRFNPGYNLHTLKFFIFTFAAIILGWIGALVFVILIALFTDKTGYSMRWYSNSWLIFGLCVVPTIGFSSVLLPFINHQKLNGNAKAQIQAHCTRIIWTVILFFGTALQLRSMYAVMISVLFNTLGFIIIYIFKLHNRIKIWQIIYIIILLIPTIFLMYCALTTMSLFIPIVGRFGSNKNADVLIGIISSVFTVLIVSPFVLLTNLVKHFKYMLSLLTVIFLMNMIFIFTPLGFPYSDNPESPAPQRYWILHTQRIFHNEKNAEIKRDSGYFLLNMDRNSPDMVKNQVENITKAILLDNFCSEHLLCGLPLIHSKMIQVAKFSTWIPSEQPHLPQQTKLKILSKTEIHANVVRYNISVAGPDRIAVYFSPKSGAKVVNTSLDNHMPKRTTVWNGRHLYFVLHIYGKQPATLNFTFDVHSPKRENITTEIAVAGFFIHDESKTPQYLKFLGEFPGWADVTAWIGSYESWWI